MDPTELFLQSQDSFDQKFTEYVHGLSAEMFSYIKTKILETNNSYTQKSFQLEIVADTNILFSEVRSLMLNGKSFFDTLMKNSFITVYAPTQLKEELYAKIKLKFPKEKKTRDLNMDECIEKADYLLSKIEIRDDIDVHSLEKAKSYLQERDKDDVSFVALNLTLKTHGILTNDKDITDQSEIKTWKLKDIGEILTKISKGTFSFIISNASIQFIWKLLSDLFSFIWSSFLELSRKIVQGIGDLITKGITSISPHAALLGVVATIAFDSIQEGFKKIWESIKTIVINFIDFFRSIWESINEIYNALQPLIEISSEMLLYFMTQSNLAIKALENLDKNRPV